MPALPLYRPVLWPCSCCGLEREFTFTSQSDQTVCVYCKRHAQDANKRNELHRDWWMQYKEQLISHYGEVVAGRDAQIGQLQRKIQDLGSTVNELDEVIVGKYNETPLGGIREHIRDRLLDDADRKMRHAYRSRDKFMAAVWRMDRLHQDAKKRDPQGRPKCACGVLVDKCKERAALAPIVSALDQWEKHEVERLEKGLDHGLPEDHPKVLARPRRWA